MNDGSRNRSLWPWVWRFGLAILALGAPLVTFQAFTDPETADPQRQDRLRETEERNRLHREWQRGRPAPASPPAAGTFAD